MIADYYQDSLYTMYLKLQMYVYWRIQIWDVCKNDQSFETWRKEAINRRSSRRDISGRHFLQCDLL